MSHEKRLLAMGVPQHALDDLKARGIDLSKVDWAAVIQAVLAIVGAFRP